MMHKKMRSHHPEHKAILYVRQSSAHQVLHNRESSTLQYAARPSDGARFDTIYDDLGRSAAGTVTVTRAGFDRMVAEVCLGKCWCGLRGEKSRALPATAATGSR